MLFDLEDYMNTGLVNRLDFVSEKSLKNSIYDYRDFQWTAKAVGDALKFGVKRYFYNAINALPLDKRAEACNKFVEFHQKFREHRVAMRPYFNMIGSVSFMHKEGHYQFQDGDHYEISSTMWNPSRLIKNDCDYVIRDTDKGRKDDRWKYYSRNNTSYEYNYGNELFLDGIVSKFYAFKSSEGEYVYQSYDESIASNYHTAVEEMMQSVKQLIIACEGYENNLQ